MRPTSYPKPCPGCGVVLPMAEYGLKKADGVARRGRCKSCCNAEKNQYRARNREQSRAAYRKEYRKRVHPNFHREINLRKNYGMTLSEYDQMLAEQNGRCAICGTDKPGGKWDRLVVDHCHQTEVVRGLLCNDCNRGLGIFKDSPKRLRAAALYLENDFG